MSFAELAKDSYARKTKEVKVKTGGGKELVFTATEISYLQRVALGVLSAQGGDVYTQLIVYSIHDQDGKYMTLDQAAKLSPEHQEVFYLAALDVNKVEDSQLKKKADAN